MSDVGVTFTPVSPEARRDFKVERYTTIEGHLEVVVNAGLLGNNRITPPAGEQYAFDVPVWDRRVTVYISPKGLSVRVWVDGVEIEREK